MGNRRRGEVGEIRGDEDGMSRSRRGNRRRRGVGEDGAGEEEAEEEE